MAMKLRMFCAIIALITFVFGCNLQTTRDRSISLERVENTSNSLSLSGYYFHKDPIGTVTVFFLYSDGTLMYPGSFGDDDFENFEKELRRSRIAEVKQSKIFWGVYQIRGDSILIDRWHPSNGHYYVFREKGRIHNDTSFVLTETVRLRGEERIAYSEVFRLKKFSPKPDSTNRWIK